VIASLLADLVLALHFGFILFAMLGSIFALRWPAAAYVHLPALAWALYVELTSSVCPLTSLEIALRRAGDQAAYSGSFVEHHLGPIIYPSGLTPGAQRWLALGLLVSNIALYSIVFARRGRDARRSG
jgi:hypothetical protein